MIATQPPITTSAVRRIAAIEVSQFDAVKRNPYAKQGTGDMPSWLSASKVIPSLLGILVVLVGLIFATMKGDVDELKKDVKEIIRQSADTRVEMVKAMGAVEKQATATNARLDQLILDGRQRPR